MAERNKEKTTKCPVSREQFRRHAQPLLADLGAGQLKVVVGTKEFSTGSLGWYGCDKGTLLVDDVPVKVQMVVSIQIIGSKNVSQE